MKELQAPEFKTYEEETAFWDNLDTADFMADDGEWFRFDTCLLYTSPSPRDVEESRMPSSA